MKKNFWPLFSRIIECYKPHGTVYYCPQGFLSSTVEVVRSFLQDFWGCWKQIFLKKRQSFQWRKDFGLIFLQLLSAINLRGQFLLVQKLLWQLLWKTKIFSSGPERLLKTQFFEKKGNLSSEEKFFDYSFFVYRTKQSPRYIFRWSKRFVWHLFCIW